MNMFKLERKCTNALRVFESLIMQKCNIFWVIFYLFPLSFHCSPEPQVPFCLNFFLLLFTIDFKNDPQ